MIIDPKWMQPPPPSYYASRPPPPPPFSEIRSSGRREKPSFTTLPSHLLLQVVYSTFPQSDGIYEGEGKVERQRRNLHWLETSLRLVNRALYIACMHILRSTYLPAYDSLIRHPYTSDPFPSSSAPSSLGSHSGVTIHRELATLDLFIALLAHEDLLLDATSLHLPREEAYKDLFDMMQPRSRLEDLVREEGIKAGVICLGDVPPPQPEPEPSLDDNPEASVHPTGLTSHSLALTKDPNSNTSPSPSPTRTAFNPFSKSSYISLAKSKIRRSTPPLPLPSPSHTNDNPDLSPLSPTSPTTPIDKRRITPLAFLSIGISFSPRKVALTYTPVSNSSSGGYNGSTFGALSMSVTGPTAAVGHGRSMTVKKTLVEIARARDESLEASAKRLVAGLKDALDAGEVV